MNRITEFEIAGRKQFLNFSTKAAKEVAARYGDLSGVGDALSNKPITEMMDEIIWLMTLLMEQGAAYKKVIDGIDVKAFSATDLEVIIGVADFIDIKNTLLGAMSAGMKRDVEVETDPKNAETTQAD